MSEIQEDVAARIRAELVCCDIYEQVQREARRIEQSLVPPLEQVIDATGRAIARAVLSRAWHDICYWGEAAARIAEGRCPGYEAMPNICRCDCCGCQHNCSAHMEKEKNGGEGPA